MSPLCSQLALSFPPPQPYCQIILIRFLIYNSVYREFTLSPVNEINGKAVLGVGGEGGEKRLICILVVNTAWKDLSGYIQAVGFEKQNRNV